MATVLVIIHGLVAVALLGAITHQTLATWAPAGDQPESFFAHFRAVKPASFATAIVVLYVVSALLGAILYFYFKIDIEPKLELDDQNAFAHAASACCSTRTGNVKANVEP